jgi:hypothetical protein
MAVLDLGNAVAVVPMHSPASFSADRDGNSVDTVNFAYALIVINLGDIFAGETVTFHIEHSETSGGTYTACQKLNSSDDATTVPFRDLQDNTVQIIRIDLNNTKRFIRARANHSASNAHLYGVTMVLMPYQTDATSPDSGAASAPLFEI